ncbi:hydrogenase maturation protease [Puniceicoccales bacterium CK1056]|uniref:Hydrogenase maturation protease n=1 Tax=Oceanipulchritudo coccoides TaxID=2706888 RepID=A0A6B2M2A7_9BACT|nr:HyaD/HybD family hydrogenase maturation endopeptidase [Oceanipulchritudo coccoides]NDV63078.1 hydrogenase maturation protease [Oceanipulchritudo coccoides]
MIEPILILGVGNLLVGDEGVGVHVVRALEEMEWPEHVHLLDGGTGGFHLLSYFSDYKRIILIDATRDGERVGTIQEFTPRLPSDFPPSLGAHDIGLKDLIGAAALTGPLPQMTVVTVSIEELKPMELELSPAVKASVPQVCEKVRQLLALNEVLP